MAGMSIVKINAITVPEGAGEELERRFQARKHAIDSQPGFEGFQLLRPVKGEERYFVVTRWADEDAYNAWWEDEGRAGHAQSGDPGEGHGHDEGHAEGRGGERKPVSSKAELLEFEVVLDSLEQD